MPVEIEVKFLDVDIDDIRKRLADAGADLEHPMRLMRRDMLDHADNRYSNGHFAERLRIRDEGDKCTMTYKLHRDDSPYPIELETTIGSYDATKQLFEAIGFHSTSYQESKRETWHLDDVEVVIDQWPWTKSYIEIEGQKESDIKAAAKKLGFDWKDAKFGSADTVYRAEYLKMTDKDSIGDVADVRFELPIPQYFKDRM
jgi:adenylate cyclase class 2